MNVTRDDMVGITKRRGEDVCNLDDGLGQHASNKQNTQFLKENHVSLGCVCKIGSSSSAVESRLAGSFFSTSAYISPYTLGTDYLSLPSVCHSGRPLDGWYKTHPDSINCLRYFPHMEITNEKNTR